MKAVKEISKIDVDFTYGARFAEISDLGKNVKLDLLDTDGKTALNGDTEVTVSDLGLDKDAETAVRTGKINLVDEFASDDNNLYLKTGTYYLRVNDDLTVDVDKDDLALQVVPIKVTEGTNSTGTKVEGKKAESAELTSQFKYIPADVSSSLEVKADVAVYKTIGDVDVLVKKPTEGLVYKVTGTTTKKLEGSVTLANLAAEGYKVTLDNEYILGTPSINITPKSGSVIQPNLAVDGGGTLEVKTALVDKEGTAITSDNLKGTIVNTDIELTDDSGNKETYSIPLVFKSASGSVADVDVDATNLALKLAGKNIVVKQETSKNQLTFTFTKLKESKYTAKFISNEFKTNSSKETKVVMFDPAEADGTVNLEMTPSIELKGSLTFGATKENGNRLSNSDVTVALTDKYGKDVTLDTLTDGKTQSKVALSKGDYTVKVTPVDTAVYKPVVETVKLDRVNGTVLTTINVGLVNKGKTFDVSGKVLDNEGDAVEDAEVAVFDATTGKFVINVKTDNSGKYATKLSNGGYVLKAYKDGNFVASVEIEVKDRAVTDLNMTTKKVER